MGRTRLEITGSLSSSTPFEVIEQVCLCHQIPIEMESLDEIDLDRLVMTINTASADVDDSIFVNPEEHWTSDFLRIALDHLDQWTHRREIPEKLEIGWITPAHTQNLDPCILYRLCQLHGVQTTRETTSDQMKVALEAIRFQTRQSLMIQIEAQLQMLSMAELSSIVTMLIPIQPYSIERLMDVGEIYDPNLEPKTHEQAVLAAGFQFQVDISSSRFPLEEFRNLSQRKKRGFVPVDPDFLKVYQLHPETFDLSKTFNPKLPKKCYNGKHLRMMVQSQGFTATEIGREGSYELIQRSLAEENFYRFNSSIPIKNQTTVVDMEPIEVGPTQIKIDGKLKPFTELICYGIYGDPMILFTLEELAQTFQITGHFYNPVTASEVFPDRQIKKLTEMLRHSCTNQERQLFLVMDVIQGRLTEIGAQTQRIKEQYAKFGPQQQREFDAALVTLLHMGMYMRSWNGKGTFPMTAMETQFDENDLMHFKRVEKGMSDFGLACDTEGGKLLYFAPLIEFGQRSFRVNLYDGEPQTIRARYRIVLRNSNDEDRACMRSSSNYFCWSAFFYTRLLGKVTPFDIDALREIR